MLKSEKFAGKNGIFATRLKKIMKERGVTQQQLADYLNITRQAVSLYLTGQALPDIDRLSMICTRLGVSSDYLIDLSDVATIDLNEKNVCEYTGLTDEAIKAFDWNIPPFIDALNFLLEEESKAMLADEALMCAQTDEEIEKASQDYPKDSITLLTQIQNYLFAHKKQDIIMHIKYSGKILTDEQDKELWESPNGVSLDDAFTIEHISSNDLVDRILLDRIEKQLKKLKHKYILKTGDSECPQ